MDNRPYLSRTQMGKIPDVVRARFGAKLERRTFLFYCSLQVIENFMGERWVRHELLLNNSNGAAFLKLLPKNWDEFNEQIWKILHLAEMLYNLQGMYNFDVLLEALSEKLLEAHYAELEVAKLFRMRSVVTQFVRPVNVAGSDYDLQIFIAGTMYCCEAKCKLESTEPNLKSLFNQVNKALKRNLPKGAPCIVCVKVPAGWLHHGLMVNIKEEVERYFEGKNRLVGILIHMHLIISEGATIGALIPQYIILNKRSAMFDPALEQLENQSSTRRWTELINAWKLM